MNQKHKLIYFSPEPEREGHASYTHVHEIINGLKKNDWDIQLFCPRHDGENLPGAVSRLWGIFKVNLSTIFSRRPDVYYMRWHFAVFPVALWAKLSGMPTVIEVNGPVDDLFIAWPITRRFKGLFLWLMNSQLRWAAGIVPVTAGLAEMCQSIVGSQKCIKTIPNGANTNQFSPDAAIHVNEHTDNLPETFLVFFGTMAKWQGIRTILRSLEEDAWPEGVHAVFVGDGAERSAVESTVKRLSYAHYLGRVPYTILPSIVARAQASFVCTENLEGRGDKGLAPLKIFESLACGLPVIATDMPYQAELVREHGCGIVIEPENPAILAQTVADIINNAAKREEMGAAARRLVVKEHSWQARADDTHQLLLQILGVGD